MTAPSALPQQFPVEGGIGPFSYAKNSSGQRENFQDVEETLKDAIVKMLDIKQILSGSSGPFTIADFGCATGTNTVLAVESIMEAVRHNIQSKGLNIADQEYQVYFNDIASNDFNTLFQLLPAVRPYHVAAVPGSFHGILLPRASLHFGVSATSLNCLSEVPKEVTDQASSAWNGCRIYYTKKESMKAYSAQFLRDLESFLRGRAQELVDGGLLAIILLGISNANLLYQSELGLQFEQMESCISGMIDDGLIGEISLENFNLPVYIPDLHEMEEAVKKNREFSVLQMKEFPKPLSNIRAYEGSKFSPSMRACFGDLTTAHFGKKNSDELYDRMARITLKDTPISGPDVIVPTVLYVLLKRNVRKRNVRNL